LKKNHRTSFCILSLLWLAIQQGGYTQEAYVFPFFKGSVSGNLETLDFNAIAGGTLLGNAVELTGSFSFLEKDKVDSLSATSLWVEFNYERRMFLKLGYFPEQASILSFFPLLNVFQPAIFSDTVRWGGTNYPASTTLTQIKYVQGALSILANFNPFEPEWTVFALDDPFFPDDQIPQEVNLGSFLGTYTLNQAQVEDPEWLWFDVRNIPEYSLEAKWQGSLLDARVLYYYGDDRQVSLEPNIILNTYPFATYDFILIPRRSTLSVLGAGMAIPLNEITLYSEIAYTWNKLLVSKNRKLSGTAIVFPTISVDLLEVSGGGIWSMPWIPVRIIAESRYAWLTRTSEDLELPALTRAASLAMESSLFSGIITLTPVVAISLLDGSQAYSAKASWSFENGFKLWCLWMQCNGAQDSELGQYREVPIIRIGIDWAL